CVWGGGGPPPELFWRVGARGGPPPPKPGEGRLGPPSGGRILGPPARTPAMPVPLLSRRDLLRIGSVGFAASALPLNVSGGSHPALAKAKSIVLLWMAGGVTHIDSFDPKPDAPEEIRGSLTTISTTIPGVRFTEVMPQLAKQTDRLALVRTFATGNDDHFLSQAMALSGRR